MPMVSTSCSGVSTCTTRTSAAQRTAPAIVFLHGGPLSSRMWQPQIEQLTDYHLLVPDLPEHGQSRAIPPFALPDAATQVAELIRTKAHAGRAHVVGLSLGAQTTVQL